MMAEVRTLRSIAKPENKLKLDAYRVYVYSNFKQVEVDNDHIMNEENNNNDNKTKTHLEWEYDCTIYDKDEYIRETSLLQQDIEDAVLELAELVSESLESGE